MSEKTKEILDGLAPLFEKADKEKLWFHLNYQDLWFSPDELRENHKKDKFLWGAVNWTLRNPQEGLDQITEEIENLKTERSEFEKRIKL